jgi:hypothetical protein
VLVTTSQCRGGAAVHVTIPAHGDGLRGRKDSTALGTHQELDAHAQGEVSCGRVPSVVEAEDVFPHRRISKSRNGASK